MKSSIIASAALVAAAAADSIGSAVVVNKCNYPVYLYNVPASGGGYSEIDKILATDGTYTQQWTQLTNGAGWSIKLSNSTNLADILQYEYTFQNDGTIWYDLSEVNGNPWDGNWEITANSATCVPKQSAYRYATDDAYGMQACPDDAIITVTLCSGESQDDGGAASASSSVAAATSSAAVATKTTSVPTSIAATASSSAVVTTTMVTSVLTTAAPVVSGTSSGSSDVVVTVTHVATTTAWTHHWGGPPSKRDAHHHHHAARNPHARGN